MQPRAQRLFPNAPTREQLDASTRLFLSQLPDLPKQTADYRAAAARLVTAVPILRSCAARGELDDSQGVIRDWLLALTDDDVAKLQKELVKEIEQHRRNLSPDDVDFFWKANKAHM